MLTPPPFERLTDRPWKQIAAIVEATRGTCGGTRTVWICRRSRSAASRAMFAGPAPFRPTIDVAAVVRPSTAPRGRRSALPQSA